jgi:hypothetical protein
MNRLAIAVVIVFFSFSFILAQEWTAEQKEVWKSVETYNQLADKGDVEGFIAYFHEDFSGWALGSVLPGNYAQRTEAMRHFMPKSQVLFSQIKPVGIAVLGNFAIVHYYYGGLIKEGEEEEFTRQRWTDILMKQGDKWVLIGDHGGEMPDDDD